MVTACANSKLLSIWGKPTVVSQESVKTWQDPISGMEFVWVPKGCFAMGSPDTENGRDNKDEGPVHNVCVDGFWIGKYEVTNAQYKKYESTHKSGDHKGQSLNSDNQPVVNVDWKNTQGFAKWLSSKNKYEFRLPTEAEWEYAARAGTKVARYWGDNSGDACGYANVRDLTAKRTFAWSGLYNCDDGYSVTAPVGQFTPNSFGLYDVLGNASEWVSDWYAKDYYATSPNNNPKGSENALLRVVRGGNWYYGPSYIRSADRYRLNPVFHNVIVGFRLVRTSVHKKGYNDVSSIKLRALIKPR